MIKKIVLLSFIGISFASIKSSDFINYIIVHKQNLNNKLFEACCTNNVQQAREALAAGAYINCSWGLELNRTPLALAVCERSEEAHNASRELLELLLNQPGIDLTVKDQNNFSILHLAASNTKSTLPLQLLLEYKTRGIINFDINQRGQGHETALFSALENLTISNIKLLLQQRIDVNAQSNRADGNFILHRLCNGFESKELECMRLLINNGALPTLADINGNIPVMRALRNLNAGSNIHCDRVATLLALGCYTKGNSQLGELLIQAFNSTSKNIYANLPQWLTRDFNPIQRQFHLGVLRALLNAENRIDNPTAYAEFNINAQDSMGFSILMWAAALDIVELMKFLLNFPGINVNIQDRHGETALHYAARNGCVECVKLLLEHPATRTSLRNEDGLKACDLVKQILTALDETQAAAPLAIVMPDTVGQNQIENKKSLRCTSLRAILNLFTRFKAKHFYAWRIASLWDSAIEAKTPLASEICVKIAHLITFADDIRPSHLGCLKDDGEVCFRKNELHSVQPPVELPSTAQAAAAAASVDTSIPQ